MSVNSVDDLIEKVRREQVLLRSGFIEPADATAYDEAKQAFESALLEIEALKNHRCDFQDTDYCQTCGVDGRA